MTNRKRHKATLLLILGLLLFFFGAGALAGEAKNLLSLSDYIPYFPAGFWAKSVYVIMMIIGWGLFTDAQKIFASGKNVEKVLSQANGKAVLYLRSFVQDHDAPLSINYNSMPETVATDEMQISSAVKKLGPLIAIGDPKEALPTLGAIRSYFSDDTWQMKFYEYLNNSQLIIISLGFTQNVVWELRELFRLNLMDKVIMYFPYTKDKKYSKEQKWSFMLQEISTDPQIDTSIFPEKIGGAVFLYIDSTGRIVPYETPISPNYFVYSLTTNQEIYYTLRCLLDHLNTLRYSKSKDCLIVLLFLIIFLGGIYTLYHFFGPDSI